MCGSLHELCVRFRGAAPAHHTNRALRLSQSPTAELSSPANHSPCTRADSSGCSTDCGGVSTAGKTCRHHVVIEQVEHLSRSCVTQHGVHVHPDVTKLRLQLVQACHQSDSLLAMPCIIPAALSTPHAGAASPAHRQGCPSLLQRQPTTWGYQRASERESCTDDPQARPRSIVSHHAGGGLSTRTRSRVVSSRLV